MKRRLLVALGLSLLLVVPAFAALKGSADVVKATLRQKTMTAAPGQRLTFQIAMDIAPRWHLYAHGDTNYIGVDLAADESFPLEEFDAAYPAGHAGEFFGEMVTVIDGSQVINGEAVVPETLARGVYQVKMGLTVQACDDKSCLAPASLPLAFELTVK
jgi:Disulphide bond corrector protein DsbC